jgi:hypothetical protein
VWQLQVNLGEKTCSEIRSFANDVYNYALPASIDKQTAIRKLVELFRAGPRLSEEFRGQVPDPVHKSCTRFDARKRSTVPAARTPTSARSAMTAAASSPVGRFNPSATITAKRYSVAR